MYRIFTFSTCISNFVGLMRAQLFEYAFHACQWGVQTFEQDCSLLRLGESQPGDMQGQLVAALAYIKKLEEAQVTANAPSPPGSLHRGTPLDPGIAYRLLSIYPLYIYTYIMIYIYVITYNIIYIYMYIYIYNDI